MYCGIDLGSRNVKIALMKDQAPAGFYTYNTIEFYRQRGRMEEGRLTLDLSGLPGLPLDGIKAVAATGYGRQAVSMKDVRVIPEIKAHTMGASFLPEKGILPCWTWGGRTARWRWCGAANDGFHDQ